MSKKISWISNIAIGITWIYQGLIPKIIFTHPQEVAMVEHNGYFTTEQSINIVVFAGVLECFFGLLFIITQKYNFLHFLNILALSVLLVSAFLIENSLFIFPFNPPTLSITMVALSLISLECNKMERCNEKSSL
ncbi:DoxX-like family protein [Candidatus Uabimicrobium sp. HlEnr_7]|uniref:DoxX-like family protein n=1 Tax=Candidatus Uabimicrobium helgolandensis TaxID=3095367 RepID=UPI003558F933